MGLSSSLPVQNMIAEDTYTLGSKWVWVSRFQHWMPWLWAKLHYSLGIRAAGPEVLWDPGLPFSLCVLGPPASLGG